MKNKNVVLLFLVFASPFYSKSQIKYTAKVEYSSLEYITTLIRYETDRSDPYYLDERVNGKEINFVNGINIRERAIVGVGVSYLNFEKIKGFATTIDLEYLVLKTKLSPLLNFRYGRDYLKNQFDVHKSSAIGGFDFGINYKPIKVLQFYAKGGVVFTHNTSFYTWRGGIRF